MNLFPRELDKLIVHQVGFLAQKRLARGVQLNATEAVALIASQILELIRDGKHSVAELMQIGRTFLGTRHVLVDVPSLVKEVQVEGTFPDGTFLVTIHDPICTENGDMAMALYGSFLPMPDQDLFPPAPDLSLPQITSIDITDDITQCTKLPPGSYVLRKNPIILCPKRKRVALEVRNDGDRPIQVGSHYHFIEVNRALMFDRVLSYGYRLDIPAGTAVRFEPGESKTVTLVELGGKKHIHGGNSFASGPVDISRLAEIKENLSKNGVQIWKGKTAHLETPLPYTIDRKAYSDMFGPTTGDRVRLGNTNLFFEIERDLTVYGDECKFGGGKVLREGMGQSTITREKDALDLVITNAMIVDYTGIYKADIGIKNGFIEGIGKAGNPDTMDGVTPGMVVGATTEALAGEGRIVTYGAMDSHIHYICPQLCVEALSSGITSLLGGGTGPNTGTNATTCTPGEFHVKMMMLATDELPLNIAFTGKGNVSAKEPIIDQIKSGCVGLKLHEDWGTTPCAIDTCLSVCEEYDVQATIHTDTLNESGFVEDSIAAFKNRTIHTYHSEGAGGGHAPDIIRVCGELHVIPSSTNPTRPFTSNTLDEHMDMLMVCHHLDRDIPEDIAFAESRIRAETIAAEDVLHDLGAISIISSDSQAMGRVGEVISRTWKTAHKMKMQRGLLKGPSGKEEPADNFRIKRYVAKYTINPAIAHGVSHLVGSVEVGKLADLVFYSPANFGVKPDLVMKGGIIARALMGDANASIPTTEPVMDRPMFGSFPSTNRLHSVLFVSQVSKEHVEKHYGLKKRIEAVRGCRNLTKRDMKYNDALPQIHVDPETFLVTADGVPCECDPIQLGVSMPMSQLYYLF